jgi:hypothetical protein
MVHAEKKQKPRMQLYEKQIILVSWSAATAQEEHH